MRKFHAFCTQFNVGDPFLVTEQLLCSYAAYLAEVGLAPQLIRSYLEAIRDMQISIGLPDPREQSSLPILKRVLAGISRTRASAGQPKRAGISRTRASAGQPKRIRLPITTRLLRQIRLALDSSSNPEKIVLWSVCCTAFFGFFRLGELLLTSTGVTFNPRLHLAWGDVAVDDLQDPKMVRVHLKQSKTDQMGQGAHIILGRTRLDLCPVTTVLGYVGSCGAQSGPFFLDSRKKPLRKSTFITEIRQILENLGFPQHQYARHSFRSGAATSATLAGVEDSTIQLLGRWRSAAFLHYVRTPQDRLAALSSTLAGQGNPQSLAAHH